MTFRQSLSATTSPEVIKIPDNTYRFIVANGDDLIDVCTAAGGHNARAAATELVDSVLSGSAPADLVQDLLIVVRDALRESPTSPRTPTANARPDLDAAIRWFGARLDDFTVPAG